MLSYTIVKELSNTDEEKKTIIKKDNDFYLVSSVKPEKELIEKYILPKSYYQLDETMIFKCDESGEVVDWADVYMVRPAAHQSTLNNLISGKLKL